MPPQHRAKKPIPARSAAGGCAVPVANVLARGWAKLGSTEAAATCQRRRRQSADMVTAPLMTEQDCLARQFADRRLQRTTSTLPERLPRGKLGPMSGSTPSTREIGVTCSRSGPTDRFGATSPRQGLSLMGREETIDLPPDSRHPSSPMAAASDRPEQGAGSQATAALVDR